MRKQEEVNPTPEEGAAKTTRQAAHSPEPWNVMHDQPFGQKIEGLDSSEIGSTDDSNESCWIAHVIGRDEKQRKANAERIASCVNALEGVKNPAAVKQLIEAAKDALLDTVEATTYPDGPNMSKAIRDELKNALRALDTLVPEKEEIS